MAGRNLGMADRIKKLPHWARVVFATRCARAALPFFQEFWPTASPDRLETLQRAIEIAERSASKGRIEGKIKTVRMQAVCVAGAALDKISGISDDEFQPAADDPFLIASVVAKTVEWCARAAEDGKSAEGALRAFTFVRSITDATNRKQVTKALQVDLDRIIEKATEAGWSERSP